MFIPRVARCPRPLQSVRWRRLTRPVTGLLASLMLTGGCAAPEKPSPTTPLAVAPAAEVAQFATDAAAAYTAQDWSTAERLYIMLTSARPEDTETWFRLGNIYARTERPELAVRAYEEALRRDPRHARAWHNLGVLRMRLAALAFGRLAEVAAADDPLRSHGAALGAGLQQLLDTDSPAAREH